MKLQKTPLSTKLFDMALPERAFLLAKDYIRCKLNVQNAKHTLRNEALAFSTLNSLVTEKSSKIIKVGEFIEFYAKSYIDKKQFQEALDSYTASYKVYRDVTNVLDRFLKKFETNNAPIERAALLREEAFEKSQSVLEIVNNLAEAYPGLTYKDFSKPYGSPMLEEALQRIAEFQVVKSLV